MTLLKTISSWSVSSRLGRRSQFLSNHRLLLIAVTFLVLTYGSHAKQQKNNDDDPNLGFNYNLPKSSYLYSASAMKTLAEIESEIYKEVRKYVDNMEHRLDLMKGYLKDCEESSVYKMKSFDTTSEREYAVVANPLIAHRLIRRFAFDFVEIMHSFDTDVDDNGFVQSVNNLKQRLEFPNVKEDYQQSLNSLLRIQKYSDVETEKFLNGELGKINAGVSLCPETAFDLGVQAGRKDDLALSVEWFEVALKKLDENSTNFTGPSAPRLLFREKVETTLKSAVEKHDTLCTEWKGINDHCFVSNIGKSFGPHLPKRLKRSVQGRQMAVLHRNKTAYSLHARNNFVALCAGNNLQTASEKSRLKCWYEQRKDSYWAINPLKMELLHEHPPLVQIYEILGPETVENIIQTATPSLKRSTVINYNDPEASDVSEVRTSLQTWLYEDQPHQNQYQLFQTVMKKIEAITGLNVRLEGASESFQIASYRTSHHYDEHLDALMDDRRTSLHGDRIATVMFYLSDVDVGGKTGFPVMGTAASPVKGSAVFWFNLLKNGKPDKRTWHGGCPVIHGVKWVANKWILLNQNWDKRKCSLNPEE